MSRCTMRAVTVNVVAPVFVFLLLFVRSRSPLVFSFSSMVSLSRASPRAVDSTVPIKQLYLDHFCNNNFSAKGFKAVIN